VSRVRLLAALLALGTATFASWRLHRPAAVEQARVVARVPARIGEWSGRDLEVTERQYQLLESRDVLLREYQRDGERVLACLSVSGPGQNAAHPPAMCYRGQGWRVELEESAVLPLAGRDRPCERLVIEKRGERHLVLSWYSVGGEESGSWLGEQWLAVAALLAGRDDPAALLRFSTPITSREERLADERARLARFLAEFLPQAEAALAAAAAGGEARPPR
jgi:EpsI family protein